jgi:hypothetical protein
MWLKDLAKSTKMATTKKPTRSHRVGWLWDSDQLLPRITAAPNRISAIGRPWVLLPPAP